MASATDDLPHRSDRALAASNPTSLACYASGTMGLLFLSDTHAGFGVCPCADLGANAASNRLSKAPGVLEPSGSIF